MCYILCGVVDLVVTFSLYSASLCIAGKKGCDIHLRDCCSVQHPALLRVPGLPQPYHAHLRPGEDDAGHERRLPLPVQPDPVRAVPLPPAAPAAHLPQRAARLGPAAGQEAVGDPAVPPAQGAEPHHHPAQHRPRLLRVRDPLTGSQHDRLHGPLLRRQTLYDYLHGGGQPAGRTQLSL